MFSPRAVVRFGFLCLAAGLLASCSDSQTTAPNAPLTVEARSHGVDGSPDSPRLLPDLDRTTRVEVSPVLADWNLELERRGAPLMVAKVEYLTDPDRGPQGGRTLFASDNVLRLDTRWVPDDTRRNAEGDDITYMVVRSRGATASGLTPEQTEGAIDRAVATWGAESCCDLHLVKRDDTGGDPTIIDAILQMGDYGDPYLADVVDGGFMPAAFFNRLAPGGSNFILAVTFTMIYVDHYRHPVDSNHDGWYDTAVKEVYYNDTFPWAVDDPDGRDLETVALHENGHALGLGHFGHLFQTQRNGRIHSAPRSVMNAIYQGVLREPAGTDRAAFCGTYATWPNR